MALQELTKCPFRCVDEINQVQGRLQRDVIILRLNRMAAMYVADDIRQCRIGRSLSYSRKDFNYLCHVNMEEWHKIWIWVRSRNCGCLVTWFCYQLIAKPGNKTAAVSWLDPYVFYVFSEKFSMSRHFLVGSYTTPSFGVMAGGKTTGCGVTNPTSVM